MDHVWSIKFIWMAQQPKHKLCIIENNKGRYVVLTETSGIKNFDYIRIKPHIIIINLYVNS